MHNNFVFDLDGTLIDNKGNLLDGVANFFYILSKSIENPKLLICTGNSVGSARQTIDKINEELICKYSVKKSLKFMISACAGAMVYDEDGNLISQSRISRDEYFSLIATAMNIDKDILCFIQDADKQYYIKDKFPSKRNVVIDILKAYNTLKPFGHFNIFKVDVDTYYTKLYNSEFNSVHLLSINKEKMKTILNCIRASLPNYTINIGHSLQITKTSKLDAIKSIYGSDLKNVVYVGDGYNDIVPLMQCGRTFALGNKSDVLQSATYAVKNFDDITKIIFYNADYSNISQKIIERAQEE